MIEKIEAKELIVKEQTLRHVLRQRNLLKEKYKKLRTGEWARNKSHDLPATVRCPSCDEVAPLRSDEIVHERTRCHCCKVNLILEGFARV